MRATSLVVIVYTLKFISSAIGSQGNIRRISRISEREREREREREKGDGQLEFLEKNSKNPRLFGILC